MRDIPAAPESAHKSIDLIICWLSSRLYIPNVTTPDKRVSAIEDHLLMFNSHRCNASLISKKNETPYRKAGFGTWIQLIRYEHTSQRLFLLRSKQQKNQGT